MSTQNMTCVSPNTLKYWHASYSHYGSWGYYLVYEVLIIAETKQAALSWALSSYSDAHVDRWTFNEIDTSVAGVHQFSCRES